MTTSGWIIMFLSVGSVTALFAWCVVKIFTTPEESKHVHGFEYETPDTEK
ncbi:MAG: hypothetical protein ACI81V_000254 [Lentimonas sp.]|jgi:hypothetical protein